MANIKIKARLNAYTKSIPSDNIIDKEDIDKMFTTSENPENMTAMTKEDIDKLFD